MGLCQGSSGGPGGGRFLTGEVRLLVLSALTPPLVPRPCYLVPQLWNVVGTRLHPGRARGGGS